MLLLFIILYFVTIRKRKFNQTLIDSLMVLYPIYTILISTVVIQCLR